MMENQQRAESIEGSVSEDGFTSDDQVSVSVGGSISCHASGVLSVDCTPRDSPTKTNSEQDEVGHLPIVWARGS